MYSSLHRAESRWRGVLQREARGLLHNAAQPEHRSDPGGHGADQDPQHAPHATARGSGPRYRARAGSVAPVWARRRRRAASPGCAAAASRRRARPCHRGPAGRRTGRPTPKPTEHCAAPTAPGSETVTSARSIRLFHDGAMTFQKNTEGEVAGVPTVCGEPPVGPGAARVEHPGDGVCDLEHVGAVAQRAVRVADLGDAEPLAVLPQHLMGRRRSVEQHRGDLRVSAGRADRSGWRRPSTGRCRAGRCCRTRR